MKESKKSGSGSSDVVESSWPYYQSLFFLKDTIEPRKSTGNLSAHFLKKDKDLERKAVTTIQTVQSSNLRDKTPETSINHEAMDRSIEIEQPVVLNIVNSAGDKRQKFLDCLLECVDQIPHESILQFRIKLMELTLKYKDMNDIGKKNHISVKFNRY